MRSKFFSGMSAIFGLLAMLALFDASVAVDAGTLLRTNLFDWTVVLLSLSVVSLVLGSDIDEE